MQYFFSPRSMHLRKNEKKIFLKSTIFFLSSFLFLFLLTVFLSYLLSFSLTFLSSFSISFSFLLIIFLSFLPLFLSLCLKHPIKKISISLNNTVCISVVCIGQVCTEHISFQLSNGHILPHINSHTNLD